MSFSGDISIGHVIICVGLIGLGWIVRYELGLLRAEIDGTAPFLDKIGTALIGMHDVSRNMLETNQEFTRQMQSMFGGKTRA